MADTRIKILAMMGKAGSGKDTVLRKIVKKGLIPNAKLIIPCTTRPRREYEVDGRDYHFITFEQFEDNILNNQMLEARVFNNWGYGTRLTDLHTDKINIGVYTPSAVCDLLENPNINLCVCYVLATDKTRVLRQLNREDHPDVHEIARRFLTDEEDFDTEEWIQPIIQRCNCFLTADNENRKPKQTAIAIATAVGQYWLNK